MSVLLDPRMIQDPLLWLDSWILLLIWVVGIPVGLYAFVHALLQRKDAYTAASKQTKPIWGAITGVAALLLVFVQGPTNFLWLLGIIASLVYILDVRPRILEIQQGRW